jgi:hypothetical protein
MAARPLAFGSVAIRLRRSACYPALPSPPPEGTSSIQTDTENIEQIRERLRKMSDLKLRQ